MTDSGARDELAAFLRARRTQLDRTAVGLPDVGRRRTAGLRREEVAALSGVSVTWYTWLEQARDVHPSRQVLDALATTLHLSPTEHHYLLSVAGFAPGQVTASSEDSITLQLTNASEVRWGSAAASGEKAAVLRALLAHKASYYDVSVPSQPATED